MYVHFDLPSIIHSKGNAHIALATTTELMTLILAFIGDT